MAVEEWFASATLATLGIQTNAPAAIRMNARKTTEVAATFAPIQWDLSVAPVVGMGFLELMEKLVRILLLFGHVMMGIMVDVNR